MENAINNLAAKFPARQLKRAIQLICQREREKEMKRKHANIKAEQEEKCTKNK